MYPNAGDVQAPSPAATPGAGKRSHVYREEWEMDEGAYGQGTPKGINPYSKLFSIFPLHFTFSIMLSLSPSSENVVFFVLFFYKKK